MTNLFIGLLILGALLFIFLIHFMLYPFGFGAFANSVGWSIFLLVIAGSIPPLLLTLLLWTGYIRVKYGEVGTTQPNQLPQPTNFLPNPSNPPTQQTQPAAVNVHIEELEEPEQELVEEEPPEPGQLSYAIKRAVLTTADCKGDMMAAADKLGIGYEGVRKSVALARKDYPDWTNWHVPQKPR